MEAHLKKYMSCQEAAKFLNISEGVVIELVRKDKLKHITIPSAKGSQTLVEI